MSFPTQNWTNLISFSVYAGISNNLPGGPPTYPTQNNRWIIPLGATLRVWTLDSCATFGSYLPLSHISHMYYSPHEQNQTNERQNISLCKTLGNFFISTFVSTVVFNIISQQKEIPEAYSCCIINYWWLLCWKIGFVGYDIGLFGFKCGWFSSEFLCPFVYHFTILGYSFGMFLFILWVINFGKIWIFILQHAQLSMWANFLTLAILFFCLWIPIWLVVSYSSTFFMTLPFCKCEGIILVSLAVLHSTLRYVMQ